MSVKETSKVQVHYTGKLESNEIFDTSVEATAKDNGIHNPEREYAPLDVQVGEHQVIPGFEKALVGMTVGESKTVTIPPAEAYGEVDPERVAQVPDAQFKESNIPLTAGTMLQTSAGFAHIVSHDEEAEMVNLDFNHPLAGKTLIFELELITILE